MRSVGGSAGVGDFNGDGNPDLATASGWGDSVSVLLNTSEPAASLEPDSLTFPDTEVGETSASQDVTIVNSGSLDLEVSDVTIIGEDAEAFRLQGETCIDERVPEGAGCIVSVRFVPVEPGPAGASLRISSNAPGSPHRVALQGRGCALLPIGPLPLLDPPTCM